MIDLTEEGCQRVLADGRIAHLGCISQGEPYVTPLSYVKIGDTLFIRTAPGRRVDAMREHPHVCIDVTILEGTHWESVILWGEAEEIVDEHRQAEVLSALLRKYGEEPLSTSTPRVLPRDNPVFAITPTAMTGKASGMGFSDRTRPGRV